MTDTQIAFLRFARLRDRCILHLPRTPTWQHWRLPCASPADAAARSGVLGDLAGALDFLVHTLPPQYCWSLLLSAVHPAF